MRCKLNSIYSQFTSLESECLFAQRKKYNFKFAFFHWVPLRKSRESCEPPSHPQNSSNFLALFGFTDHWNLKFTKSNHSHQLHLSGWTLLSFFNRKLLVCTSVGLKIYALWSMDQNWPVDIIIVRYNAYIKDTLCWSQRDPRPPTNLCKQGNNGNS